MMLRPSPSSETTSATQGSPVTHDHDDQILYQWGQPARLDRESDGVPETSEVRDEHNVHGAAVKRDPAMETTVTLIIVRLIKGCSRAETSLG